MSKWIVTVAKTYPVKSQIRPEPVREYVGADFDHAVALAQREARNLAGWGGMVEGVITITEEVR